MLKYMLAATALKAFSTNDATKAAYRKLGNFAGGLRRSKGIKPGYIERADANLAYIEEHGGIADGMQVLELGTGWVHWESLYMRLFYDVRTVLFDVWDNRQFNGFQFYAAELRKFLRLRSKRPSNEIERAELLLDQVLKCASFDELYKLLNWRYVINKDGLLEDLSDESIDLIYSSDVMEHIPASAVNKSISEIFRTLRPGGFTSHQIVESDHLTIYDRKVHAKNYLRYTDKQWNRFFENDVQYINRLQHSDYIKEFVNCGFEIVDQSIVSRADTSEIKISPQFDKYSKDDLDASVSRVIARRPLA